MSVLVFQRRNRPRVLAFQRNFGVECIGVSAWITLSDRRMGRKTLSEAPGALCKGTTPAEGDSGPEDQYSLGRSVVQARPSHLDLLQLAQAVRTEVVHCVLVIRLGGVSSELPVEPPPGKPYRTLQCEGPKRCCMDRGGDEIRPFPSGSVRRCVRTQAARVRSLCSELSGRPGSP